MYIKIFLNLVLMILLFLIQVGFISGLPSWFGNINVVLVVVLLIMGFGDFKTSLIWAISLGALLDTYSFSVFGLNIIGLTFSLFITNFLLENLLTNRSLYTFLVLTFLASLFFEILALLVVSVSNFLRFREIGIDLSSGFWIDEASKLLANMVLTFFLFHLLTFFSKRFRPMFLIR